MGSSILRYREMAHITLTKLETKYTVHGLYVFDDFGDGSCYQYTVHAECNYDVDDFSDGLYAQYMVLSGCTFLTMGCVFLMILATDHSLR